MTSRQSMALLAAVASGMPYAGVLADGAADAWSPPPSNHKFPALPVTAERSTKPRRSKGAAKKARAKLYKGKR